MENVPIDNIYPDPGGHPAPQPDPAQNQPPSQVVRNPFVNMARGFKKFARTNLLLTIIYSVALAFLPAVLLGGLYASHPGFLDSSRGALGLLLSLSGILIALSVGIGLIWSKLLLEGVRGRRLSIGESLRPIKKFWIPLIYIIIFMLIAVGLSLLLLAAAFRGGGGVGLVIVWIISIVLGVWLLLRWSFVGFTIVDYPDSGVFNSLKRSSQLTKGYRFSIFVLWLLIFVLSIGISASTRERSQPNYSYTPYSTSPQVISPQSSDTGTSVAADIITTAVGLVFYAGFAELYRQVRDEKDPPAMPPAAMQAASAGPAPITNPVPPAPTPPIVNPMPPASTPPVAPAPVAPEPSPQPQVINPVAASPAQMPPVTPAPVSPASPSPAPMAPVPPPAPVTPAPAPPPASPISPPPPPHQT